MINSKKFSDESKPKSYGWIIIKFIIFMIALGVFVKFYNKSSSEISKTQGQEINYSNQSEKFRSESSDDLKREQAYKNAIQAAEDNNTLWPQTPQDLIQQFWEAASKKDYSKLILFCPGSVENDYKFIEKFPPSAMKAIGTPYKHEKDANVFIYPVTVPFPHFPNKTIKMAIRKSESGKLIIDGALTIWW